MSDAEPVLSVRGLSKHYPVTEGLVFSREVRRVRAVDGVSFDLYPGETLGLVGETGCGKSTTATTILRLLEPTDGTVLFDGEDVTEFDGTDLARFRRRVQMVFQDPTSSLDPKLSIGESVGEPLLVHGVADRARRRERVETLLTRVGLSAGDYDRYPHELSGGQKQRAALARALSLNPDVLIADEPVNALDVSVQAEILSLLDELKTDFGLSVLFISHDLNVVREVADRTAVMYLGKIVEKGPTDALLRKPKHPYTEALVGSIPVPDPAQGGARATLTGDVPEPSDPPSGCRFHTRCPAVIPPDDLALDREAWRSVVALRRGIETGALDPDDLRSTPEEGSVADGTGTVRDAIRGEYGLPAVLSDEAAEAAVADALDAVVGDEFGTAMDRLDDAFPSVCIREAPDLDAVDDDRVVACHLYE